MPTMTATRSFDQLVTAATRPEILRFLRLTRRLFQRTPTAALGYAIHVATIELHQR